MVQVEVDPETVGQYTGKKEEDGSKIFEGDCLGTWGENDRGEEAFAVMGVVTWVDDMGRFLLMDGRGYANDWTYEEDAQPENWGLLMIEGNIHDNPELLRIVNE